MLIDLLILFFFFFLVFFGGKKKIKLFFQRDSNSSFRSKYKGMAHGLWTPNEGINLKFGLMWQTKYVSAVPKNLGLGLNFRPCSAQWLTTVIGRVKLITLYHMKA